MMIRIVRRQVTMAVPIMSMMRMIMRMIMKMIMRMMMRAVRPSAVSQRLHWGDP